MIADVLGGRHQEAGSSAGRVADLVTGLRRRHVDHELDDVPRGPELSVGPGGRDLGQHVLVQVARGVAVVHRDVVEHVDHPGDQGRGRDGEAGVLHVLGVGRAVTAELAEEREHLLPDGLEHDAGLEVLEPRPAQVVLTGLEDRTLDRLAGAAGLVLRGRLQVVEPADEEQVGDLLDHLQGVGDAAGPERVPDPVDLALQLTGDHPAQPRWLR